MSKQEYKYNGYSIYLDRSLSDMVKNIEGRILTIIDASYSDKEQKEALKCLVREAIWMKYPPVGCMSATHENVDIINQPHGTPLSEKDKEDLGKLE